MSDVSEVSRVVFRRQYCTIGVYESNTSLTIACANWLGTPTPKPPSVVPYPERLPLCHPSTGRTNRDSGSNSDELPGLRFIDSRSFLFARNPSPGIKASSRGPRSHDSRRKEAMPIVSYRRRAGSFLYVVLGSCLAYSLSSVESLQLRMGRSGPGPIHPRPCGDDFNKSSRCAVGMEEHTALPRWCNPSSCVSHGSSSHLTGSFPVCSLVHRQAFSRLATPRHGMTPRRISSTSARPGFGSLSIPTAGSSTFRAMSSCGAMKSSTESFDWTTNKRKSACR